GRALEADEVVEVEPVGGHLVPAGPTPHRGLVGDGQVVVVAELAELVERLDQGGGAGRRADHRGVVVGAHVVHRTPRSSRQPGGPPSPAPADASPSVSTPTMSSMAASRSGVRWAFQDSMADMMNPNVPCAASR